MPLLTADLVIVLVIVIPMLVAPAVILYVARRKQKRGHFPEIDPGLGGYQAFPIKVAEAHPIAGRSDSLVVDDDPVERIRARRRRQEAKTAAERAARNAERHGDR